MHCIIKMPSMSVNSFSDTDIGKQEALWRKMISDRQQKKATESGTAPQQNEDGESKDQVDGNTKATSAVSIKDGSTTTTSGGAATVTTSASGTGAGPASSRLSKSSLSESDLKAIKNMENTGELVHGDSIGAEAVINGTPMFWTIIALGDVSCFVLTRGDLLVLLEDGGEDGDAPKNFEAKLQSLESVSAGGGSRQVSYVDTRDNDEEVDWASLRNLGKLGAGTFGTVYMMTDKNNVHYAMKVLDKRRVKEMKQDRRVRTEKQLLLSMSSPFICKCFGVNQDSDGFYFLLELVTGGELKRLIHPADRDKRNQQHKDAIAGMVVGIPIQPAKFYIAAISIPLKYLHRRMIAFRDLKPENVMIDKYGYPKLIDFGLAKPLDESGKTYTLCGTPEFLAPEVIMGHGHNQAVDWWALGVLLFEMIVGISPFIDRSVARNKQDQMTVFEVSDTFKIK
jgi:tRNA A-37 threonylcarbamoyl transferase component Bud32